jgi:hypothetical protein
LRYTVSFLSCDVIADGFTADVLQATLDQALEKQVLIVPTRAAEGIEGIVAKRKDEIGQLRLDVDKLPATIFESQNP